MPKLRRMSGQEVVNVFCRFGFVIHNQRGSHIKLRRIGSTGEAQTLTVPDHRELDTGTLRAIIRQATRYIPLDDLREHFYV